MCFGSQLDEDDDLIFDDGTAPEFVLDSLNEAPSLQVALGRLGGALGFLGGVFVLAAGYHTLFRDDRQVRARSHSHAYARRF